MKLQRSAKLCCATEEVAKWLCSVGIKISLCYLLFDLSLMHWKHSDISMAGMWPRVPFTVTEATDAHSFTFGTLFLLIWLLPKQLSSRSPGPAMAEVSITAFNFTDQKTETQKCKTNCFSCDAIIYKVQLWSIQVYLFDPSAFLSFWGAFLWSLSVFILWQSR